MSSKGDERFTDEQRLAIARRFLAGERVWDLVREFQVGANAVRSWAAKVATPEDLEVRKAEVRKRRKKQPDGPPPVPEHLAQRALEIRRDYMPASDAAKQLGVSNQAMRLRIRRGLFPGAFQIGGRRSEWLLPRESVEKFPAPWDQLQSRRK